MSSQLNLLQLSDDDKLKILEHCDLASIFTLRKVCHDLRNLIDDTLPDATLDFLCVRVDSSTATIVINDPEGKESIDVVYGIKSRGNRQVVQVDRRLYRRDYLDVFFEDLQNILKHQKSVIKKMIVSTRLDGTPEFIERLFKVLKSLNFPLKVENFGVDTKLQSEALKILPCIDAGYITNIGVHCWDFTEPYNGQYLILKDIYELPQWKNAKTCNWDFDLDTFQYCLHFESLSTLVDVIKFEELVAVKKMMAQSPTLKFVDFNCRPEMFPMICNGNVYRMENDGKELVQQLWNEYDDDHDEYIYNYEDAIHLIEVESDSDDYY